MKYLREGMKRGERGEGNGEETKDIASRGRRLQRPGAVGQRIQIIRGTANLIEADNGSNQPTG